MAMSKKDSGYAAKERRHAATLRKIAAEEAAEGNEEKGEYRKGGMTGKKKAAKRYARGGGIEVRGKTRGKMC